VSEPAARPSLVRVPTLADVQADPDVLNRLPVGVLVDLRRQVQHLTADLDAAISHHVAQTPGQSDISQVLDKNEAAKRLDTSPDSLYRKRKRLRLGYIDPLDGRLKFTAQEIEDYIGRQRRG
jgi:hypothetical protein